MDQFNSMYQSIARDYLKFRLSPEFNSPSVNNFWHWHTNEILAEIDKATAGTTSPQTVIDFGSGDGLLISKILHRFESVRAVGIDINGERLRFLAGSCSLLGEEARASAVLASLYRVPVRSEVADLAICSEVVEHLTTDSIVIREMFRVLRPGGTLILATPNSGNVLSRIARITSRTGTTPMAAMADHDGEEAYGVAVEGHINEQSARYWSAALSAAGFQVERVRPVSTRYGGQAIDASPTLFALALLLDSIARRVRWGYHLSCGLIIRARRVP